MDLESFLSFFVFSLVIVSFGASVFAISCAFSAGFVLSVLSAAFSCLSTDFSALSPSGFFALSGRFFLEIGFVLFSG